MSVDPLAVRRLLGRHEWSVPIATIAGWGYRNIDGDGTVIVSTGWFDGIEWKHASMTRDGRVPSYEDLCRLRRAVFGDGWAYQVFAPPNQHINHHDYALHLWGRADGARALPDFGWRGTI
jgi:hypothetical protein